jgi:hypothetical protein
MSAEGLEVGMDIRQRTLTRTMCGLGMIAGLVITTPSALAEPQDQPTPTPPANQSLSGDSPAAPTEVPHLSSPGNLPPGTADVPVDPLQGRSLSYLRELWHAMQTQNVSTGDAILLLTQRPLDPNPIPPPGLPPVPQPPLPGALQPPAP